MFFDTFERVHLLLWHTAMPCDDASNIILLQMMQGTVTEKWTKEQFGQKTEKNPKNVEKMSTKKLGEQLLVCWENFFIYLAPSAHYLALEWQWTLRSSFLSVTSPGMDVLSSSGARRWWLFFYFYFFFVCLRYYRISSNNFVIQLIFLFRRQIEITESDGMCVIIGYTCRSSLHGHLAELVLFLLLLTMSSTASWRLYGVVGWLWRWLLRDSAHKQKNMVGGGFLHIHTQPIYFYLFAIAIAHILFPFNVLLFFFLAYSALRIWFYFCVDRVTLWMIINAIIYIYIYWAAEWRWQTMLLSLALDPSSVIPGPISALSLYSYKWLLGAQPCFIIVTLRCALVH